MNRGIVLNTTKFSVMDASKAFKKSRTTIYEALKNGELSRDNDGLIDLSELIRVYGNPIGVQQSTRTEHVQKNVPVQVHSEIEQVLKDQINLLKSQLDLANQREKSLMQHIEDLTHRIEFKGNLEQSNTDDRVDDEQTTPIATNTADTQAINTQPEEQKVQKKLDNQHQTQLKKRSLFGRVLNAVFDND